MKTESIKCAVKNLKVGSEFMLDFGGEYYTLEGFHSGKALIKNDGVIKHISKERKVFYVIQYKE
jgi:hypothetical protein